MVPLEVFLRSRRKLYPPRPWGEAFLMAYTTEGKAVRLGTHPCDGREALSSCERPRGTRSFHADAAVSRSFRRLVVPTPGPDVRPGSQPRAGTHAMERQDCAMSDIVKHHCVA